MDIRRGNFSKLVQNQLGVGHIVAQVFFFQSLEAFVFTGIHTTPGFAHQIS